MKKTLFQHWSTGNLYFFFAFLLAVIFLLDSRIGLYDWKKEIAYFNVIKTSLISYQSLPLFWWNPEGLAGYPAISVSSFFIGNPETFAFSPLVLLLYLFDTIVFMKLLYLLFLGFAILGIQKLGKKLHWQSNQQRIFSALFLFSPIIIQHIAIGYFPWLNLFLFPWLLFFLFEEKPVISLFGTASVLSLILLQGGLHPFVWYIIFSGVFFFVRLLQKPAVRIFFVYIGIMTLTILLSYVRLSTSMQTFADFQQSFFNGYSPSGFIRWGLTPPMFTPKDMDDIEPYIESYDNGVPFWDGAIYWGGVLFLAIPALIIMIGQKFSSRQKSASEKLSLVFSVGISALIMILLSFGTLYRDMIIPVSNFIQLPALQGMEKYPFRFALLGYSGCSFVVANYFDDISSLINRILEFLAECLKQFNHFLLRITQKDSYQRLLIIVIMVSIVYAISIFIKDPFLTRFSEIIRKSYDGQSYPWLASLMSRRASIPFSAYQNKMNNFYFGLQGWILRIAILGWLTLLLIIKNHQIKRTAAIMNKFLTGKVPEILEISLVLPLLFASLMWMRVALATPVKEKIPFSFVPPVVEIVPSSFASSISFSVSPDRLKLVMMENAHPERIVFTNLKFSDHRFLQTGNLGGQWFDQEGRLGLIPSEMGALEIGVDRKSYQPALAISILSWLAMFVAWIIYYIRSKRLDLSEIKFKAK